MGALDWTIHWSFGGSPMSAQMKVMMSAHPESVNSNNLAVKERILWVCPPVYPFFYTSSKVIFPSPSPLTPFSPVGTFYFYVAYFSLRACTGVKNVTLFIFRPASSLNIMIPSFIHISEHEIIKCSTVHVFKLPLSVYVKDTHLAITQLLWLVPWLTWACSCLRCIDSYWAHTQEG